MARFGVSAHALFSLWQFCVYGARSPSLTNVVTVELTSSGIFIHHTSKRLCGSNIFRARNAKIVRRMVRLFGRNNGRNQFSRGSNDSDNDNPTNKKLRLSPSAALENDGLTPSTARNRHSVQKVALSSPMYEYALDEYAQAVAPGTSNDDGRSVVSAHSSPLNTTTTATSSAATPGMILQAPSTLRGARSGSHESSSAGYSAVVGEFVDQSGNDLESGSRPQHDPYHNDMSSHQPQEQYHQSHMQYPHLTTTSSSVSESAFTSNTASRNSNEHVEIRSNSSRKHISNSSSSNIRSAFEKDMPDVTYEEVYGPAYIGGTIKYVYPTGYQSMRPRSCPWKLSIAVCLLFTWLSIFIVGHCSDQADESAAAAAANADGVITDDALVMEIRWCGSRLLYMMWATSMMVTGLSAAYCSVIGYIKFRDFAVANSRSQPPGVAEGKSDYYVRIRDHALHEDFTNSGSTMFRRSSNGTDGGSSVSYFQPTIYQADGTPQFWGSHIYRPTQAAVAVTHR